MFRQVRAFTLARYILFWRNWIILKDVLSFVRFNLLIVFIIIILLHDTPFTIFSNSIIPPSILFHFNLFLILIRILYKLRTFVLKSVHFNNNFCLILVRRMFRRWNHFFYLNIHGFFLVINKKMSYVSTLIILINSLLLIFHTVV